MTAIQAACFPVATALVRDVLNPPTPLPETAKARKNRLARERWASQKDLRACDNCRHYFNVKKGEIRFGPDPYRSEIHHDNTEMWLCTSCARTSADHI